MTMTPAEWLTAYRALDDERARVTELFEAANVGEGSFEAADTARFDLNERETELTHSAAEIIGTMVTR